MRPFQHGQQGSGCFLSYLNHEIGLYKFRVCFQVFNKKLELTLVELSKRRIESKFGVVVLMDFKFGGV